MAIVKVKFRKSASALIKYVLNHGNPGDPVDSEGCPPDQEGAIEEFRQTRVQHDFDGKNQAVHVIQSWDATDSKKFSPEEFNAMGRRLVQEYFKGHQFLVVTHTDTDFIHNHIVVNSVNMDTGLLIEKKYKHLHKLRAINDSICLEHGLKVPNKEANDRAKNVPERVRNMTRFGRQSWVMDIKNKADVARHYATSYDEYTATLDAFGVKVRVEDKNITYFYPGRSRGKRGDKFGKYYDKPGLEKQFRANDERYAAHPEQRDRLSGSIDKWGIRQGHSLRDPGAVLLDAGISSADGTKDYSKFTPVGRRTNSALPPSDRQLAHSVVPIAAIQRAKGSIPEYCKRNKIALITNNRGEQVLQGREHVIVSEFTSKNTKNGTHGSLIDFVAAHHNLTLIQAIAKINGTPELLLLERHFGEVKRNYTSFYIPKPDQAPWEKASHTLSQLLRSQGINERAAEKLLRAQRVEVSKSGVVRLFAEGDSGGASEFHQDAKGTWNESTQGRFSKPFFKASSKTRSAAIFTNPQSYLAVSGAHPLSKTGVRDGILALMKPDPALVDLFVVENPQVKRLEIVTPKGRALHQSELDFFGVLSNRYKHLGIEVAHKTHEKELSRPGPELSL